MLLPHPFRERSRLWRGFTLIELLTVIAIIGVLAAIVLPTISAVRNSAYASKTASNLRQLQAGNLLYATENKGFLAPSTQPFGGGGNWNPPWFANRAFLTYLGVKGPWEPSTGKDPAQGQLSWAWDDLYPEVCKSGKPCSLSDIPTRQDRHFSIAMNMTKWSHNPEGQITPGAGGAATRGMILLSKVKNPSRFLTFYEAGSFMSDFGGRLSWAADDGKEHNGMAFRNRGVAYVAYCDGHVGSLKRADIEKDSPALRQMFYFDYQ